MKLKPVVFIALITALFYTDRGFSQSKSHKSPKIVYVVVRDGAVITESPDSTSAGIYGAKFGDGLAVIKDYENWFEVIAPNRGTGYIRKSAVVNSVTQIPLTNDDLAEPYKFNNETITSYPNIEIRLITKQRFYAMKKTAVSYFVTDTNAIVKHKHTLKLPIKKGFKTFVDRDENGADWDSYFYKGQYPLLNKYLVYLADQEAEDDGCLFVDKTTGLISNSGFPSFPYLSVDKKMLICVHASNSDEFYTELSVDKVVGHQIFDYGYCLFKNWMPISYDEQFWGSDGCFYLPVLPSAVYLSSNSKPPGYNYRYIKIKIKGPSPMPDYKSQ